MPDPRQLLWATANRRQKLARGLLPALLMLCALAQGCTSAPPRPLRGADPADAEVRVPTATYRPVLGPYSSQRPVEPAPWDQQNKLPAQKDQR